MKPVGYLLNKDESLAGERGIFYDYILAGNGLYIHAANAHLDAIVPIAYAQVRGLAPLERRVTLRHGRIPWPLYHLAYSLFITDRHRERYVAVVWQDGYHLKVPEQEREPASVRYFTESSVVLDIHSHGTMSCLVQRCRQPRRARATALYGRRQIRHAHTRNGAAGRSLWLLCPNGDQRGIRCIGSVTHSRSGPSMSAW